MDLKTNNKRTQKGITLIALVVTIVVLLILAGVSLNAIFSENGIINRAKDAQNKMDQATQNDMTGLNELDKLISSLTDKTTEDKVPDELERYFLGEDKKGTLATTIVDISNAPTSFKFIGNEIIPDAETSIEFKQFSQEESTIILKFKYKNGYYIATVDATTYMTKTVKVAVKTTMFDTGKKVRDKMYNLMPEGTISKFSYSCNVSIDAIEKYNGVPDLTKLTEANIVSLRESNFPIYMWAEKSGKTEIRNPVGMKGLTAEGDNDSSKKVETGKIYWWSESDSVYLNSDSAQMFAGLPYLTNIDGLKDMKTDYVVNMSDMFYSVGTQLSNIDALSGWNTSKVENMSGMFYRWSFANSLSNVNALLNWDTSKVKNMSGMFAGNFGLTDIEGLKKWNTSNVTDMHNMFGDGDSSGCAFINLSAISNWNVKNVTNMNNIFNNCRKLEDVSAILNWNITEIAHSMFLFCSNLKTITIPSTITKIGNGAFVGCANLTKVKILATDATKFEVGSSSGAFNNIASNSKIYVLSEEIKAKLEGCYDTSKTTVEVVTLEQMNNL
jgi:surface protein